VAGAGLSVDRGAGKARQGGDLLERRDGICNQDQIGKGYAPKGQTPILTQTGQKFSTSMIAAVSNRGLMRFKLYKGALNVAIFIDFMKRLLKDAKRKVFLIVDNLRVITPRRFRIGWRATRSRSRSFISRPMRRNTTRMNISTTI